MSDELIQELRAGAGDGPPDHLDAAIGLHAVQSGEHDAALFVVDTPLGPYVAGLTPRGLVIFTSSGTVDDVADDLAERLGPRVVEAPGASTDDLRRQVDEYFTRRRTAFDVPLDWSLSSGFRRHVLQHLHAHVGYGETLSYGDLAAEVGRPGAARAVGGAMGSNPIPIVVPCHRVLAAGGGLGGYGGGLHRKEHLLQLEGLLLG